MSEFAYSIVNSLEDAQQLGKIIEQCFVEPGESEPYLNRIGRENHRIIRQGQQIVGGLAIIQMGQWWGGQSVPMAGIASVGIAPEYRGSHAALTLMQHTVKELYDCGVPISVLFAATQHLYRKAGYEQAGTACGWKISTGDIQIKEKPLAIASVKCDQEILQKMYNQQATLNNGNLDRSTTIWKYWTDPDDKQPLYTYIFGTVDKPQGYIIFSQEKAGDDSFLLVKDWVVLTLDAAKTFWAFLANHRTQMEEIHWKGSSCDILTLLLPEQNFETRFVERWLLRVINVPKALLLRGYPQGTTAELHLEVEDDLITENNGKFILTVANGRGEVTKGGKGELKIDVRSLAPLYTGLFTPRQLQLAGKIQATATSLAAATQIFAGTSPWMPDFF